MSGVVWMKNKKIGFISLGCSKNLVDSENMLGILSENDYEITKILQAVNGRSYVMNLSMNIDVTETQ